jgi:hypothetical protein
MNKPNFFIVGAPKCGTTSLGIYLRKHPNVFFCPIKEPNFFCEDFPGIRLVKTQNEYLRLFSKASLDHIAIGEASTRYLWSSVAIRRIYEFDSRSKIIIMLRNPIDLVYSFHSQCIYSLVENEKDFKKAWKLQERRAAGYDIPTLCVEQAAHLQYKNCGMIGEQVRRVFNIFPRDQVRIFLFEDFINNTLDIYKETLCFLGLRTDGRNYFPRLNESKRHKSLFLAKITDVRPKYWHRIRDWIN